MHELSLAQAIADTVNRKAPGQPVRQVDVRIGHLRQVVPSALTFAWEMIVDDTHLAGAELIIDHVAAVVRCGPCGAETELDLPVLACSQCGSTTVELISGEEFQLVSIDLAEESSEDRAGVN